MNIVFIRNKEELKVFAESLKKTKIFKDSDPLGYTKTKEEAKSFFAEENASSIEKIQKRLEEEGFTKRIVYLSENADKSINGAWFLNICASGSSLGMNYHVSVSGCPIDIKGELIYGQNSMNWPKVPQELLKEIFDVIFDKWEFVENPGKMEFVTHIIAE